MLAVKDTKYAERLQSILGLEKAYGKQNPCPTKVPPPGEGERLEGDDLHIYKRCTGILMYMCAERPDLQYVVKVLSSRSSTPTVSDLGLVRHVVKYLKLHPVIPILLEKTVPGKTLKQKWDGVDPDEPADPSMPFGASHVVEVVTDADWGSQAFAERRSISSYCIFVNGNLCHAGNRVQKVISLSSAESELMATLLGLSEGIFIKHMLQFLVGPQAEVKLVHMVDNAATRSILQRQGLGRTRHISLGFLWAQKALNEGVFETRAIATKDCPADLQTKSHSRSRMAHLMNLMGVGGRVVMANRVNATPLGMGAGQVLRALALLLEGGGVVGQSMEADVPAKLVGLSYVMNLCAQNIYTVTFLVILFCMIVWVAWMAPKRRWNRNLESREPQENMNQVQDRVHAWFTYELGDEVNQNSASSSRAVAEEAVDRPVPQDGDRGDERWLMCGMSPVNSDDDEGGAVESYVGTYIHDPSDEVANTENVQHREPEQMPIQDIVYIVGAPKRHKGYHKQECGMVRRWLKDLPSNVAHLTRDEAVQKGMKPCKQCRP